VVLARLKPGVGIGQAQAQMRSIQAEVNRQFHAAGASVNIDAFLQPMQEALVARSRTARFLMAAVSGLMLIACLNLANAQLGRAIYRQREAAVRSALGASKWRLIRVSLADNLVLAVAGGGAGVLLAAVALAFFRRSAPVDLPRLAEVHLNPAVLLFCLAATLAPAFCSACCPRCNSALPIHKRALQSGGARAAGDAHGGHMRTILVGVEVFGCAALLVFTGLFSKSLLHLLREDKGFDTACVTVAETDLPHNQYASDESRITFDDAILNALRGIPSVESAAMVSAMPLGGPSWKNSRGPTGPVSRRVF